jgi:hypothetical protein
MFLCSVSSEDPGCITQRNQSKHSVNRALGKASVPEVRTVICSVYGVTDHSPLLVYSRENKIQFGEKMRRL